MKKVLIGVLILIPIIIVASVLLTTNIISKNAYLPVDRVELNETKIEFSLDKGNIIDTLKATVYPRFAKNHNLIWSIEEQKSDIPFVYAKDDECDDCANLSGKKLQEHIDKNHIDIATIDNNGVVTVNGYGSFVVKVTTEEGNKFATCNVKVVGDKVTKIDLMPYGSNKKLSANDSISLDKGERLLINPIFTPSGARNKSVTWSSTNDGVVEVDKNGILTAKGTGDATISVVSNDTDTGVGASVKVSVKEGVFKKESYCYTTGAVNVNDYLKDLTKASVTGGRIVDGMLQFEENSTVATVTVKGKTFSAFKVESMYDDDIVFKNYDILLQKLYNNNGDKSEYIIKRGLPIYLEVVYRDPTKEGVPDVKFSSTDITPGTQIVNITNLDKNIAIIEPNKEGDVKITAVDKNTGKSCSTVELKVVTPVVAINLALNATDAKRGIAAETVFGNKVFNDADCKVTIPYYFYMDFNYPKDVDFENFEFSTSDESIAKFSDKKDEYNKLMLMDIPEEKKGLKNKVTITIKAKYPMYDNLPVVAKYVLNVIDGYTVKNEKQLKTALSMKSNVAVYVNDTNADGKLVITPGDNHDKSKIIVPGGVNIYGNGYIICYDEKIIKEKNNDYYTDLVLMQEDNVHIENTVFRAGYNDPEAKNGLMQWDKMRRCVNIHRMIKEGNGDKPIENISFKYCIFENAKVLMEVDGANVDIEGCIFRNSSANSFYMPMTGDKTESEGRIPTKVNLKNSVFTHSALIPIYVYTDFNRDLDRNGGNGFPENATWEDMKDAGYTDHLLHIEGFLDIYNWISIDDFASSSGLIPPTGLGDDLDNVIKTQGSQILAKELMQKEYAALRHNINGKEYVHLAIAIIGLTSPVPRDIVQIDESAGYNGVTAKITASSLTPDLKVLFNLLLKDYVRFPMHVFSYKKGNYQIGPDSEKKLDFQETGALYKNLREGRSTASL